MPKRIAAALLVLSCLGTLARAQTAPECRNLIGVYTAPAPTPATAQALANYNGDPGVITAYVVLTNPYNAILDRPIAVVGGFEFAVVVSGDALILDAALPPLSANFHPDPGNWLVGTNIPVVEGSAVLLTLTIGGLTGAPGAFHLAPVVRFPSLPGGICIADYEDAFSLSAARPASGDFTRPVFGLYTGDAVRQTPCAVTTWHVAPDGDDATGDGSLLAPWATVQRAIDAAVTGDRIVLADGTYTGAGNRDLHLDGKGLTIASASGDPDSCVIDAERDESGTRWVFRDTAPGPGLRLEGLSLVRGASGAVDVPQALVMTDCIVDSTGTGVVVHDGTFTNTRFRACGIGLLNADGFRIEADSCLFSGCDLGVRHSQGDGATFRDCTFAGNGTGITGTGWKALGGGPGASGADKQAAVSFTDCTFSDNGYGISGEFAGIISHGTFSGNSSAAARFSGFGWMTFESCTIADNPGSGIDFDGGRLTMTGTRVLDSGGFGVRARTAWSTVVTGCTIAGNGGLGLDAGDGSGSATDVEVANSTIAGNAAGLHIQATGDVLVTASIVAFNLGEGLADAGAVYADCDVFANGADAAADSWVPLADGNIAKDPLFCDAANDDYGLAANSPCAPSPLRELIGANGVACDGVPAPVLLGVEDVPDDQGLQVRLTWYGSGYDVAGSALPVVGYDVYRRIDTAAGKLLGWDYVLRVPARGDQGYQVVAPTLGDAAPDGTPRPSVFLVSAVTAEPAIYFDSAPDSGSSVDNLVPGVPADLAVAYAATGNRVSWTAPADPDLVRFEVWRSDGPAPGEDPGEPTAVLVGTAWLDTTFSGTAWDQAYWVAAVDDAGNRGPLTDWSGAGVSATGDGEAAVRFALLGNVPNPFNPATTLRFDLPAAATVDLAIYDVAGRLLRRLVAGQAYPAGRHEKVWDGRDDTGRAVGSGVYLYRIMAGENVETRRMTLVR